jgi:uncharacterized protein YbaP (TraB family)
MRRLRLPLLLAVAVAAVAFSAASLVAAAAPPLPIFDAHLHYNEEALAAYPVADVMRRFRSNGVQAILATSRPNVGTRLLAATASADGAAAPRVVPFIRPYHAPGNRGTWFADPATLKLIEDELARDIGWQGIGEFHVFGRDAGTDVVKRIVALAAMRGLWLHAHCDEEALALLLAHDASARVIWAHAGFSTPPERLADYLARHPNLVLELSYRYDVTTDGKLAPAWRKLFLAYPDRFVVGSDTWVNERWARYDEIIAAYRGWLAQLPADVGAKIAHRNGERLFPPPPPAPDRRGLLFRIDKPGIAASYVYGTLHSDDPRVTALPPPVAAAFTESRTFATEGRLSEAEIIAFFEAAQFADERRLADFFDHATIDAMRVALEPHAPSEASFQRLKPWAVMLMLAEKRASEASGPETLDAALLAQARARRLAIVGLELADEQVAAFDAIPLPVQVTLTRFVLEHRGGLARAHEEVIAAWLQRDLSRLAALNLAPGRNDPALAAALVELTRNIIDNRSAQMAHRLFVPLKSGRVFVAVGALHLYGPKSLLALVRDQGYRVTRVY